MHLKNKDSSSKYIKVLLNKEDISSKLKSLRLVDSPPCYLSFYFEYKDYFNYINEENNQELSKTFNSRDLIWTLIPERFRLNEILDNILNN